MEPVHTTATADTGLVMAVTRPMDRHTLDLAHMADTEAMEATGDMAEGCMAETMDHLEILVIQIALQMPTKEQHKPLFKP